MTVGLVPPISLLNIDVYFVQQQENVYQLQRLNRALQGYY